MARDTYAEAQVKVAPLTGSVDRNAVVDRELEPLTGSLPSRGAWIEIYTRNRIVNTKGRSPHGERG